MQCVPVRLSRAGARLGRLAWAALLALQGLLPAATGKQMQGAALDA